MSVTTNITVNFPQRRELTSRYRYIDMKNETISFDVHLPLALATLGFMTKGLVDIPIKSGPKLNYPNLIDQLPNRHTQTKKGRKRN